MNNLIQNFIILCLSILRWVLIIALIFTLVGVAIPYISSISNYPYLMKIAGYEILINEFVKSYIPTRIAGYDLSRAITIVAILITMDICRTTIDKIKFSTQRNAMRAELEKMQKTYKSVPGQKDKIALMENKLQQANLTSGKNRQELLKDFASIKRELEKIGRDLAFLAIDVADSTGMKVGEDPAIVEHDFLEYHNYVDAKFKDHGLIKAAWTPDGVMACFNNIEDAVQAAKDILNGLDYFNKNVKSMKRDFTLRCGVNGGHVFYDDSIPLEQFSDRVIDIAGHMQKYAPPNSILIAKQMIEPVKSRDNFSSTERVVDGLEVCEWGGESQKSEKSPSP